MSPEYAMGGIFSEKSDVFSVGVILLEIVSGRKNTSFNYQEEHLSLIAYVSCYIFLSSKFSSIPILAYSKFPRDEDDKYYVRLGTSGVKARDWTWWTRHWGIHIHHQKQ